METILYISGIISGVLLLTMLQYRYKYIKMKSENSELGNDNQVLQNNLDKYITNEKSRIRRGIYTKVTLTTQPDGIQYNSHWLVEVTEIEKTLDKSKIKITNIKNKDTTKTISNYEYQQVGGLVGDWVKTDEIEWIITKTPQERRTDKIDDILESEN